MYFLNLVKETVKNKPGKFSKKQNQKSIGTFAKGKIIGYDFITNSDYNINKISGHISFCLSTDL